MAKSRDYIPVCIAFRVSPVMGRVSCLSDEIDCLGAVTIEYANSCSRTLE